MCNDVSSVTVLVVSMLFGCVYDSIDISSTASAICFCIHIYIAFTITVIVVFSFIPEFSSTLFKIAVVSGVC